MNDGQKQFFQFIMERTESSNEAAMKELLENAFEQQKNGTFEQKDMMAMVPKMVAFLREDAREEVMAIVKEYGSQHVDK
ncbi:hypothetical protein [Listeria costaricensis]|uniref:hypothetical protein n=1 Tax=Listeria costaricensis TaxID=2026604 RepID=UPI000C079EBF|nr:hypothetical protein [Listeria costaricensis]